MQTVLSFVVVPQSNQNSKREPKNRGVTQRRRKKERTKKNGKSKVKGATAKTKTEDWKAVRQRKKDTSSCQGTNLEESDRKTESLEAFFSTR